MASLACNGEPDGSLPPAVRALAVPVERLASAEARERGAVLYRRHCALCHGERADGKGVRTVGFDRAPADFTSAAWRRDTTARGNYFAIREGIAQSAMPAWKWVLDEPQTWDVVAFVRSVGAPK